MAIQQQAVWSSFLQTRSVEVKRDLVLQYLDLVRYVVSKLGQNSHGARRVIEKEDMVHYGVLGLILSIDRFSPTMGVKFETFAVPRIRGAILDELRKLDWVPRSVRANSRRLEEAAAQVTRETGREAVDLEIAGKLAMTVEEYQKFITETGGPMPYHRPGTSAAENAEVLENIAEQSPNPFEQLTDEESRSFLVDAVNKLPPRERAIIALYYYEGLRFGEIGKVLRISESRVSQIHSEVLRDLRTRLTTLQ
jgi:RNA polymerase sigma factor FliA